MIISLFLKNPSISALSFYMSQNVLCRSKLFEPAQKFDCIYALSFYRSQNVLGWSKFFVLDQKFIDILWQSQSFCVRQTIHLGIRFSKVYCVVLLHVPKCFGLVQIFCARPKIYLHIVAVTKILSKKRSTEMKFSIFCWNKCHCKFSELSVSD